MYKWFLEYFKTAHGTEWSRKMIVNGQYQYNTAGGRRNLYPPGETEENHKPPQL
jgi:hypothetical protein